jgi:AraC-like DNA-binding protein
MLYLERAPHPALTPYIKTLWYARDLNAVHGHQRVLPAGHSQIVISLARDYLTDANHPTDPLQHTPPALYLGLYSRYQWIDAIDFAELIGIVFRPGGTLPFFKHPSHLFSDRETSLEDLWGVPSRALRDRLREGTTPSTKFALLEGDLFQRLQQSGAPFMTRSVIAVPGQLCWLGQMSGVLRNPIIDFALRTIDSAPNTATVASLTRSIGLSPRRLSQLFREQVGISPKLYCRIQRFQQAVQSLHRGEDLPWAELALACGYYAQSHFSNDFRAFSGINPTTYTTAQRPWANHIAEPD